MSQQRRIQWLNDKRIVYRRDPISDTPTIDTEDYSYYENGTYECYHLFNSKAKITTYKSLKWHFLVLYYLNEEESNFTALCKYIANKDNGFVTFFIKDIILNGMIKDVIRQGGEPPSNKLRKVIFKDYSGLDLSGKLKIVGQLIGRSKLNKETIYQCMLDINHMDQKITTRLMSNLLGVSQRTIYRNMCNDLKQEKTLLNEEI
jgi:hypothetical protein|tara:strand:+ start:1106 stop:1714 length:609 start_codon:yes stop_codon:yes gene_type:complete